MRQRIAIGLLALSVLALVGSNPSLDSLRQQSDQLFKRVGEFGQEMDGVNYALDELFDMVSVSRRDVDNVSLALDGLGESGDATIDALCDYVDVKGDSYRPFVCEPRCGCPGADFEDLGLDSCSEQSGDTLLATGSAPSSCVDGMCSGSLAGFCNPANPVCPQGFACARVGSRFASTTRCVRTCSSDAECPAVQTAAVSLSGVGPPGTQSVVTCWVSSGAFSDSTTINMTDAMACLDEIEALTGPCR